MNRTIKTVLFWVLIFISAMLFWQVVRSAPADRTTPEITYSRFISDVESKKVSTVTITGSQIRGIYREGTTFRLTGPASPGPYLDALQASGVEILFRDVQSSSIPLQLLGTWAPLILLGALWFYMIRQMQKRRSPPSGQGSQETGSGPPIQPE